MSKNTVDIGRLKWAIMLLVLLSAAGGATVWWALEVQKSADRTLKTETAARNDMRAKLSRAREEQAELRDKIDRFAVLRQRGYIGPEQRLDWVEALARIKAARRIQLMDYEFAPQRPVDAGILPGGPNAGGYTFLASQMRMKVLLLHEGELLKLIEDMRNAVAAMIQVRSCSMERIVATPGQPGNPANLTAECTLEWITVKDKQ